LLGHEAHDFIDDTSRHSDGCNFVIEQTSSLGSACFLLAASTVFVHAITGNFVTLGNLLGGLQHVPVNFGLHFGQRQILQHVLIGFLLNARNAFYTTCHIHLAFTRNDALRSQSDGLQTG